jgi:hypothetical protein
MDNHTNTVKSMGYLSRKTKMLWPGQENTILKTIIW